MDGDRGSTSPEVVWLLEVTRAISELAPSSSDAERIDRIGQFETLKSVLAAAQLREAVAFDASQRTEQAVAGVPSERQGRGIAAQLGLASRQSPWHARRWLGWGKVLTSELPQTFAELEAGRTTEWRALLAARETVWLSREDRAEVDGILAPQLHRLADREVENLARANAQRLDPAGAAERRRVAERERRVTIRPRPDTMSSLTATHTVARGVEMYAQLRRDADALVGTGHAGGRTRDQVMADLLYDRVTGRDSATGPAVEVELLMSADSLFGNPCFDGDDAAEFDAADDAADAGSPVVVSIDEHRRNDRGVDPESESKSETETEIHAEPQGQEGRLSADPPACGDPDKPFEPGHFVHPPNGDSALLTAEGIAPIPIPAALACQLIVDSSKTWLRRLFTAPETGELIAMESTRRLFTDAQKCFIRARDQLCSTPFCGAPIRHADHAIPAHRHGPTDTTNGNGKCVACNIAKQGRGWRQTPLIDGQATITTPTGHTYSARPPLPPGSRPQRHPLLDVIWQHIVDAA